MTDDAVWATVFGAVAAAGSIMLARRAEALPGRREKARLDAGGDDLVTSAMSRASDRERV